MKFDKKLLDFDYGEEEDDVGTPAQHHLHHHQQQQQVTAGLDSIGRSVMRLHVFLKFSLYL